MESINITDYLKDKPDSGVLQTGFGPLAYDTRRFTVQVKGRYRRIRCETCGESRPFALNQEFASHPFLQHWCEAGGSD